MPLNDCFGCHCGINGSVLDVRVFYFCVAALSLVHVRVKGLLSTARRTVQLSAGLHSKCVIMHLDHKLAITSAYVVIIWRQHCYRGTKAISAKGQTLHCTLDNNKATC